MPEGNSNHESCNLVAKDTGLHLKNSILWLDDLSGPQLSFLSIAPDYIPRSIQAQLITTAETAKILDLQRKKYNPLICQYNRPFSIGRLRMELLPSGYSFGSASLFVETCQGSLLYAPYLQPQRIPTQRRMQLRQADTLVLSACAPFDSKSKKSRLKQRNNLVNLVQEYVEANEWPCVICLSTPTAQELTRYFSERSIPLAVHNKIYQLNKLYESHACSLGSYALYHPKRSRKKVTLLPLSGKSIGLNHLPKDRPIILVVDEAHDTPSLTDSKLNVSHVIFNALATSIDISNIIEQVRPATTCFFGPFSREYVEKLDNKGYQLKALYPNYQPTLF